MLVRLINLTLFKPVLCLFGNKSVPQIKSAKHTPLHPEYQVMNLKIFFNYVKHTSSTRLKSFARHLVLFEEMNFQLLSV